MAKVGDVYKVRIYFKGKSGTNKPRPVLIIDQDEEYFTIVELTSVEPKEPPGYFDNCKQKIVDWVRAGLDEESYAKCHKGNIHRVEESRLFEYLGTLTANDLINVLEKVNEVNL
ncbi:type II toxin-antitoxin system PemK/MazF family toxin [Bacillus dakarensis]|uniref:type II toxin-antitoxin system PemK/MazF family toxin n=1 Tax=Robertmurraya dakarensis TaxID=1926278 RepID=UPI0009819BDC|nr:type II toxin-antitoxin system PemK/MazF family toxin [Bacillus dakarensis]